MIPRRSDAPSAVASALGHTPHTLSTSQSDPPLTRPAAARSLPARWRLRHSAGHHRRAGWSKPAGYGPCAAGTPTRGLKVAPFEAART